MASLINRNGTYYGQWHDANRKPARRRHSLRTTNKRVAHRLLDRADEAYQLRKWDPWIDPITRIEARPAEPSKLGATVQEYLAARRTRLRAITLENYRSLLKRFTSHVGRDTPIARIRSGDVEAFACSPDYAETTQQTRLVVMRAFFRWAVANGHLEVDPTKRIDMPRAPSKLPRAVRSDDLEAIVSAIEKDQALRDKSSDSRLRTDRTWLIPCYRFAFLTGLRASELARLRWEDVDFNLASIKLEIQKNKKAQYLPLGSAAIDVLAEVEGRGEAEYVFCPPCSYGSHRNVRAFSTNLNRYFRTYVEAAGISRRLTLHGLRHGFCTHLAERGASAFLIQAAARHGSVKTSQVYVSISGDVLREGLDLAFE